MNELSNHLIAIIFSISPLLHP